MDLIISLSAKLKCLLFIKFLFCVYVGIHLKHTLIFSLTAKKTTLLWLFTIKQVFPASSHSLHYFFKPSLIFFHFFFAKLILELDSSIALITLAHKTWLFPLFFSVCWLYVASFTTSFVGHFLGYLDLLNSSKGHWMTDLGIEVMCGNAQYLAQKSKFLENA